MSVTTTEPHSVLPEAKLTVSELRDRLSVLPMYTKALDILDALSDALDAADEEAHVAFSIAATLTEEFRMNFCTIRIPTETFLIARAKLYSEATQSQYADAIPGIFPYGCDILTFSDNSQCFVPAENDQQIALPFLLTKHCEFYPDLLVGDRLPRVFDSETEMNRRAQALILKYRAYGYSDNTKRTYGSQWKQWMNFANSNSLPVLPAEAEGIAFWMTYRVEELGLAFSTIKFGLQVIRTVHKEYGQPDPGTKMVLDTRDSIRRRFRPAQAQVTGLNAEDIQAIEAIAREPRLSRGGKPERPETALARGNGDIALVRTMYDGLLRTSETCALIWGNLTVHNDGTGSLLIEKSKTDQEGIGQEQYLSPETVAALERIRGNAKPTDQIFSFSKSTLKRKVKSAAKAAKLEGRYSGHSGRVGMAQDLVENDFKLPAVAIAGRWKALTMPTHYAKKQSARKSAVARQRQAREEL